MAKNSNLSQAAELNDLKKKVEWLDNERRKLTKKVSELEQQTALQEREISGREKRIQDVERQLANTSTQLNRIPQVDTQLGQFKDEIVQLIEQYDKRRLQSEAEMDRLRRVEHESTVREIADMRKEFPAIVRLQKEMDLRQSEEARLANLIGNLQNSLAGLNSQIDSRQTALSFLEEKEKQNSRNISDLQTSLVEINKRWEPVNERFDVMANNIRILQTNHETVLSGLEEVRESLKGWMEQIQIGEYERNQRLEKWRQVIDEQNNALEQFNRDWITFSDQYKEAKMAVQTLSGWQKQIEQQQHESSEILRMGTHRLESRWDDFKLENEKKWKSQDAEIDQRISATNRTYRQIQEQITAVEEALANLNQEKDTIWRIQTAQADAIKQLPRIWLEEVENAIKQNPNRRRQPALVPVREDLVGEE